jgi:hypothetical protein
MTSKLKLHLLVHLRADIVRFGPLVGVATETFECFNAIFRFCSIFSNHLAPSRDIALQLASQEVLKHRLTGGWWPMENGEWERPGLSVRSFIHTHPTLQALMGWTTTRSAINGMFYLLYYTPRSLLICLGSFKLEPLKRDANHKVETRTYVAWSVTRGAKALNCTSESADSQWMHCRYAVARSEDECFVGSWIFAGSPFQVSLFCITSVTVIITCYYFVLRVVVSLLARLLKFWQISLANVPLLYLMYLKSFPPDMKSLECQCWLDNIMKQLILSFPLQCVSLFTFLGITSTNHQFINRGSTLCTMYSMTVLLESVPRQEGGR